MLIDQNSSHSYDADSKLEGGKKWPWIAAVDPFIYSQRTSWPKISIVTPSFNQGEFIEETILSILNQNYPNLEYVVIDGGSTDNTINIIKKYEDRITYWISEEDHGQSDAINKGLERCTGEIFNWINSDDLLAKDSLLMIASEFDPSTTVVAGYCSFFWKDLNVISYKNRIKATNDLEDTILNYNMCQPPTFYRLDIVKKLGCLSDKLNYIMDSHLWLKYVSTYGTAGVKLIDHTLSYFRLHGDSKTVSVADNFIAERVKFFSAVMNGQGLNQNVTKFLVPETEKSFSELGVTFNTSLLDVGRLVGMFAKKYDLVKLLLINGCYKELLALLRFKGAFDSSYKFKMIVFWALCPKWLKRRIIKHRFNDK